MKNKEA